MDNNMDVNTPSNGEMVHVGAVDLVRFICSLLIMAHHMSGLNFLVTGMFFNCWAWVDYFFILTGYFTRSHFEKHLASEPYSTEAMKYTWHKFKRYIPYEFAAVILMDCLLFRQYSTGDGMFEVLEKFMDFPYEVLLLSSSGIAFANLATIWFLSAMAITLPLLIYLMVSRKDLWNILSWMIPLLYYGRYGVNSAREWPNDLLRAFSCMALGTFLYALVREIRKASWIKGRKMLLTLVEVAAFGFAVYITVYNKSYLNLVALLFSVNVVSMLSGCSWTSSIKGGFLKTLGQMSMPMFLFHLVVGSAAGSLPVSIGMKIVIYYLGTIAISFVLVQMENRRKKYG